MQTDEQKLNIVGAAAQLLLENGSETYRVEETARRMAKGFGIGEINIAAFPTSVFLEAGGRAFVRRISRRGTNSRRIAMVNEISREVEQGRLSPEAAGCALEKVRKTPGFSQRTMILAYALAAASFCLLFDGDAATFAVTFAIGVLVQAIQPLFAHIQMGVLLGNFVGGWLTAVAAQMLYGMLPIYNVNAAIIGGIMPLLSGAGDDHRRARHDVRRPHFRHDARAGSHAAGDGRGHRRVYGPENGRDDGRNCPVMRKIIVAALGAFGGTLGYGYILNAPKNTILPASFIGLAGYIVYILLGMAGFGTMSAYFFSTVFVSVVCELLARKMRTPSTIFLLGALVPLVPGYNFYLAMLALVENRGAAAAQEGMVAVQIVAAIAVGAAVTSVLFRALAEKNKKLL